MLRYLSTSQSRHRHFHILLNIYTGSHDLFTSLSHKLYKGSGYNDLAPRMGINASCAHSVKASLYGNSGINSQCILNDDPLGD